VKRKRLVTALAAVTAVAAGSVGAIAATRGDDPKTAEETILADAAKRLEVSPAKLRAALLAAQNAQLDRAVKEGFLTKREADAMKRRRERHGSVLGVAAAPHLLGPLRGHPRRRFGPPFGPPLVLDAAAKALGISRAELRSELRKGRTLSAIAKARGKTLADVRKAMRAAVARQLDREVKAGRLTDRQRDAMLDHLSLHLAPAGKWRLRHRFARPPRAFRSLPLPPGAHEIPVPHVVPEHG
jgi:hypothetical protein